MNPETPTQPESTTAPTNEPVNQPDLSAPATSEVPAETPATPSEAPVTAPVAPAVAEDPGKTLAIVGIVLAFVFTIAGLIVSIIAQKKSKAAGFDGHLAKIGVILNTVFLVLGTIIVGIMMAISITAYSNIQERAQQQLETACVQTPTDPACS